jgi:hypothetical protein
VARENAVSYRISANGSAGDWYWEVTSDRTIIARGVAPTTVRARVDALNAARSHTGWPMEDLCQPLTGSFPAHLEGV